MRSLVREELVFTAESGETQGNTSEDGHLCKGQLSTVCVFMPEEMDWQCYSILAEAVKIKHQKLWHRATCSTNVAQMEILNVVKRESHTNTA